MTHSSADVTTRTQGTGFCTGRATLLVSVLGLVCLSNMVCAATPAPLAENPWHLRFTGDLTSPRVHPTVLDRDQAERRYPQAEKPAAAQQPLPHAAPRSYLMAHLRECSRNPEPNTGYASWGNGDPWMKNIAHAVVDAFDGRQGLTVRLKYGDAVRPHLAWPIADLFRDDELSPAGRDDDSVGVRPRDDVVQRLPGHPGLRGFTHGIDHGVFHFHVGHGGYDVWGPEVQNGVEIDWREQKLGNCSRDGRKTGELRYYFLCSCRGLAHGPRVKRDNAKWEYDRPSAFDPAAPVGSNPNRPESANVFERLGPVLSENMRMVCGFSTSGKCGVGDPNDNVVLYWSQNYFDPSYSVADAWGLANAKSIRKRGYLLDSEGNRVRPVFQTPLCIARGSGDLDVLRSPITDDDVFTEQPNPYAGALHVKSWEVGGETAHDLRPTQVPALAPVFLMQRGLPARLDPEPGMLRRGGFVRTGSAADRSPIRNGSPRTKEPSGVGIPGVKKDRHPGQVTVAGTRKPISKSDIVLPTAAYAARAEKLVIERGWKDELDRPRVIRGMLQVKLLGEGPKKDKILKQQSEITFVFGRRIDLGGRSARVFGADNEVVIQLNNDGTLRNASRKWSGIKGRIDDVPVKTYRKAYQEAIAQLGKPELYELSSWDWGYLPTTGRDGTPMMAVYFFFSFDPVSKIEGSTGSPLGITIQGQRLPDIPERKGAVGGSTAARRAAS